MLLFKISDKTSHVTMKEFGKKFIYSICIPGLKEKMPGYTPDLIMDTVDLPVCKLKAVLTQVSNIGNNYL